MAFQNICILVELLVVFLVHTLRDFIEVLVGTTLSVFLLMFLCVMVETICIYSLDLSDYEFVLFDFLGILTLRRIIW